VNETALLSTHFHQIFAHSTKALFDEPTQATFLFTRDALFEIKSSGLVDALG
jgi:hypothetical protein